MTNEDVKNIIKCLNSEADECKCINPPKEVLQKGIPYYCWYEPCITGLTTEYIRNAQTRCNQVDCVTKLKNVKLDDTSFTVDNVCGIKTIRETYEWGNTASMPQPFFLYTPCLAWMTLFVFLFLLYFLER